MEKIKLKISYDGFNYHGWQKQKNAITIQQKVEEALEKIYKMPIETLGASRTDAKVHAKQQVVTYEIQKHIPKEKIPYALNTYLPPDIVVYEAQEMPLEFHPRYNAKKKTYCYTIYNESFINPMLRNYCWFIRENLDIKKMQEAAPYFLGTHDFSAFRTLGSSVQTTVRTLFESEILWEEKKIIYKVSGDGFLYNMVRIIVGTLVEVGKGKIKPEEISSILYSCDRNKAGKTAPPQGLCLEKIEYK